MIIKVNDMDKTIYYVEARGSSKRLTAIAEMQKYLDLGYNIVVVTPNELKQ